MTTPQVEYLDPGGTQTMTTDKVQLLNEHNFTNLVTTLKIFTTISYLNETVLTSSLSSEKSTKASMTSNESTQSEFNNQVKEENTTNALFETTSDHLASENDSNDIEETAKFKKSEDLNISTSPILLSSSSCANQMTSIFTYTPQDLLQLNSEQKNDLRDLCWETMFGQELAKLTIMDLMITIVQCIVGDFLRALFVRSVDIIYINTCECAFSTCFLYQKRVKAQRPLILLRHTQFTFS